jgi:hypothetical protein
MQNLVYTLFDTSSLLVHWPEPYLTKTSCVFPKSLPFHDVSTILKQLLQSLQLADTKIYKIALVLFEMRDKIPASSL